MRFQAAIPAAEILRHCHGLVSGPKDGWPFSALPTLLIEGMEAPEFSTQTSLTFLGHDAPLRLTETITAALILAEPGVKTPKTIPVVEVASIHVVMAGLISAHRHLFHRPEPFDVVVRAATESTNCLEPGAIVNGRLEGHVYVGSGAYVGNGSYIGSGTHIGPGARVLDHCYIGRNCMIQSGAVIGSQGFGFFSGEKGLEAMPHFAGVELGEDCWIGANSVIAAGVLYPTTLGRGCKLDSHVQVAHNVRIGQDALLASQSGIAGSTVIGDRFQMGGAASIDGHLCIGDDVSVAACSGVTKDLPDKSIVAGFPARPLRDWRRQQILVKHLADKNPRTRPRHG